jgi:hypothetical protein
MPAAPTTLAADDGVVQLNFRDPPGAAAARSSPSLPLASAVVIVGMDGGCLIVMLGKAKLLIDWIQSVLV